MKLLLHICCANCVLYPLKSMREKGIQVKGFWFNPNIHPYTEYKMRLEALKELERLWRVDIIYRDLYGLEEFIRRVVYEEKNRCEFCYSWRLQETAKTAKAMGMDAFSSSLLVSPYQKFDIIIEKGRELQERFDIEFFEEDFREGWKEGMRISKELGLYRQKYCGCIYSEQERYLHKGRRR